MKTTKFVVLIIAILTGSAVIAVTGVQENNKVSIDIPSSGEIVTSTPTATPIMNATVTPTLAPLPTGSIPLPTTPPNPDSIDDYYFNR